MTKDDVAIRYTGDDPGLKEIFSGNIYALDYRDRSGSWAITTDALYERSEVGPGHLFYDDTVWRYNKVVGRLGENFELEEDPS